MGLAEPEGAEASQRRPDAVDLAVGEEASASVVEALCGAGAEGVFNGVDVAFHAASQLVGVGEVDAHAVVQDAQHVLVVDHHAVAVLQKPLEPGMQIVGLLEAQLGVDVGGDHVALHGARPEQRDVGDEVFVAVGLHLADQLALAWRLDLEHAERVG